MSMIEYKNVPYYVAGDESAVGIIVIQEWYYLDDSRWGLNGQIKKVVDRYAKSFKALAITPDLYRGKVATKPDEANHLMSDLNWPKAVEDVKKKYFEDFAKTKDYYFFLGTTKRFHYTAPNPFVIIGDFRPKLITQENLF